MIWWLPRHAVKSQQICCSTDSQFLNIIHDIMRYTIILSKTTGNAVSIIYTNTTRINTRWWVRVIYHTQTQNNWKKKILNHPGRCTPLHNNYWGLYTIGREFIKLNAKKVHKTNVCDHTKKLQYKLCAEILWKKFFDNTHSF